MRALLALLLLVPILGAPAAAQSREPEVTVQLATPLVRLGAAVPLQVTVEHTDDAQLLGPLPEVDGLLFGQPIGPSVNKAFSLVQGVATHRVTVEWSIRVRPTRAGTFEIPPLRLTVAGEEVTAPAAPMQLEVIEDSEGARRGYFDLEVPERVFEGQPFTIEARFGFDQSQPVDRHDLYLPWWKALRGVIELEPTVLDRGRDRIVVNDRDETDIEPLRPFERDGSVMRAFQFRSRYLASRPGTLQLGASTYRFGVVLERGRGFSRDRVQYYYAQSDPVEVEVVPVPEEGRPFEWSGAVGSLDVSRRVDRRDLQEGDTLQLTVSWTGEANLAFLDPPDLSRLDAFSGFRLVGTTDESFADERRVRYDLLCADPDILEVPPVPLWTFDPETEAYRLVESRPVPIRVRAVEGTIVGFEEAGAPEAVDLADVNTTPRAGAGVLPLGGAALAWTGAGLPLAWLLLRTLVRRRGDPAGPEARRRRLARRRLARELASAASASAQGAALARFLAARTREPEAAWVGRDVEAWAAAREGLAPELATALVEVERELDQRAWASEDQPLEAARLLAVADQVLRGGLA